MRIPIILVVIALLLFYIIVPILIWIFARNSKIGNALTIIFSILFVTILFFGITSRISFGKDVAEIYIDFSAKWCDKTINFSLSEIDSVDLLINVIMLIPVGLVVVYYNKKSITNKIVVLLIVGVLTGAILETMQFVLPVYRSVQLSDVLLNTLSVLIGGSLGLLYNKILNRKSNR